ncbi:MAG: alpha/beta hydrolase [Candidatus Magnetomorum sp.]|nr:alpha/beta hydrolase [Candidatus Magnetomorum sp.]
MKTLQQQDIQFFCDGLRLMGTLHLPEDTGQKPSCIIGSHGLFSDASSPKQIALANACTSRNMAYFRFDHRGCGRSEGDFKTETTITNRFQDYSAATQTIKDHPQLAGNTIGFFGSSLGGSIALLAGISLNTQAIVTLAAPISMHSVWDVLIQNGQDQLLSKDFYEEAIAFDIMDQLHGIKNILIFHGSEDEVVPLSNAHQIYQHAEDPKNLIILDGGCHRLSETHHQQIFMKHTLDWFASFLT